METNLTIEQALVENSHSKGRNQAKGQTGRQAAGTAQKASVGREATQDNLAQLENGPMMSTSEILDFASGIDSTEYDQP